MSTSNSESFIAVVDDNLSDLTIAGFLIEREGYQYKLFDSFAKLIPFLREQRDNVKMILMDVEMPGLSGIDILKRVKREPAFKTIPIVMMTGDSTASTVQKAISFGALDYLVKPLDPMIFEGKISKLLKNSKSEARQQWVEYRLSQIADRSVDLKVPATFISVGELSMTLTCEYDVAIGSIFIIETPFLKEIGLRSVPLKIESSVLMTGENNYELRCSVVGLPEADLQKIRILCKSLIRHNIAG